MKNLIVRWLTVRLWTALSLTRSDWQTSWKPSKAGRRKDATNVEIESENFCVKKNNWECWEDTRLVGIIKFQTRNRMCVVMQWSWDWSCLLANWPTIGRAFSFRNFIQKDDEFKIFSFFVWHKKAGNIPNSFPFANQVSCCCCCCEEISPNKEGMHIKPPHKKHLAHYFSFFLRLHTKRDTHTAHLQRERLSMCVKSRNGKASKQAGDGDGERKKINRTFFSLM